MQQPPFAKPCFRWQAGHALPARHQASPGGDAARGGQAADPVRRRRSLRRRYPAHDFVTGRSKRAIEDHFDTAYELENELRRRQARTAGAGAPVFGRHGLRLRAPATPLGLGHAVLCAEPLVGNEPFAVTAGRRPDDGALAASPCWRNGPGLPPAGRSLLAVQEVPADQVHRYGIVAGEPAGGQLICIDRIVEKPAQTRPRAWAWRAATSSRLRF